MPHSLFAFILFVSFFIVSASHANELHTLLKQRLKSTSANQLVGQALSGKTCKQGLNYTQVSDYTENCVCNAGEQCLFNTTKGLVQGCSCQYGPCTNAVCPEPSCVPATLTVDSKTCNPEEFSGVSCPDGMALTSFSGCAGTCCRTNHQATTSTSCINSGIATDIQGFSISIDVVNKCLTGLKLSCFSVEGSTDPSLSTSCPKDLLGRTTFIQSFFPAQRVVVLPPSNFQNMNSRTTCCAILD